MTGRKGNTEYLALLALDGALDEPSFLAKL